MSVKTAPGFSKPWTPLFWPHREPPVRAKPIPDTLKQIASDTVAASYGGDAVIDLDFNAADRTVNVTAAAASKTAFMQLANIKSVDIAAGAEAVAAGGDVEIAMVVDVTASMAGSRIINLRTAATTMVDTLLPGGKSPIGGDVRVSMVPYAESVNVGTPTKINVIAREKQTNRPLSKPSWPFSGAQG